MKKLGKFGQKLNIFMKLMNIWKLAHIIRVIYRKKQIFIAFKRDENLIIPKTLNYDSFPGLSNNFKVKI